MEKTYEKEGNKLKVTAPLVQTFKREQLENQKEAIRRDIASLQSQYDQNMQTFNDSLVEIDILLAQADALGVKTEIVEPAEPVFEVPDEPLTDSEVSEIKE